MCGSFCATIKDRTWRAGNMVRQFQKRPVVIDAQHFDTYLNAHAIAAWCGGVAEQPGGTAPVHIKIPTLEGTMIANVGDYIIKGIKGEFYPCKPDIFHESYMEIFGCERPAPLPVAGDVRVS
jgi:hypothetical protein